MEIIEEEKPVSKIMDDLRKQRRDKLKEHQEFNRLKAFDSNRLIESEVITEHDIAGLCSRIKRRKHAQEDDLRKLGNGFIQSESNITAFIKVTGALDVVIKELTGSDRNQHIRAAQCLCNLSLGDETCSSKIALFAGSYLMIFVVNLYDSQMTKLCLWITQNLIAAGPKPMNILMSQELVNNCLYIMNNSMEHQLDAVQLLDIVLESKWKEFQPEVKQAVQQSLLKILQKNFDHPIVVQAFLRTVELDCWSLSEIETNEIVKMMTTNLISLEGASSGPISNDVVRFSLKILEISFSTNPENVAKFLEFLVQQNVKITNVINITASNPKYYSLVKELMHFTAFISTIQHPYVAEYFSVDSVEDLKIPKLFEF